MKKCELCQCVAKVYCDSDQARLCWDCDARVHTANFIVEKHLRTLLCHVCQAPTIWTASGPELAPTLSLCQTCAKSSSPNVTNGDSSDRDNDGSSDENDDSDDEDDGDDDDDDDDGDNQVVPMASRSSSVPPPHVSTSSSSNESAMSFKRNFHRRNGY